MPMNGLRFRNLLFVTSLGLVFGSACEKDVLTGALKRLDFEISRENIVIQAGTSFGKCLGYCQSELEIQGTAVSYKQSGWDAGHRNLPDRLYTDSISVDEWDALVEALDWQVFTELDSVIGCPDCADGGAEWLDITYFGQKHRVTFDYGAEVTPIQTFLAKVREIRQRLLDRIESRQKPPRVILTNLDADSLQADAFDLDSVSIHGDTLVVSASYAGGCRKHFFSVYMIPDSFMESYPVQANLFLIHHGSNDPCDAIIRVTRRFDLIPVRDRYRELYGLDDRIILNLFGFYQGERGQPVQVEYRPGGL